MRYPELTQTLTLDPAAANLEAAWRRLREDEPALRIRDAAERLGVSEAALLALNCGATATRLEAAWAELILSLPRLGRVMALTRNDHAVHEKHGRYATGGGATPADALPLRLFPETWRFGYAVAEPGRSGERHSLQFFDAHGRAVHKVYLTGASHRPAYENLVERYAASDQSPWQEVAPEPSPAAEPPGDAGFAHDLKAHGFLAVAGQRRPARLRALLLAGRDRARPVSNVSAEHVLTLAAGAGLPLEISLSSPGATQTHSGTVHDIRRTGPWINVLDEGFNLHLRDARLGSSWVVWETVAGSGPAALELFDGRGWPVARFAAGLRPGEPEPAAWREVLDALPAAEVPE